MNVNKSDASTSTDDIKGRPLCLFYFTHPFGVVSPEPPTVTAAPPHISRAFLNMQPVSPFTFWTSSTEDSYNSTSSARPPYDLGKTTVHQNPVSLATINTRKFTRETGPQRDYLSSSLLSSEIWFESSSSCKSDEQERMRRLIPYNKLLPPLELPRNLSTFDNAEDLWSKKFPSLGKFSLPPIELPALPVMPLYLEDAGLSAPKVTSDANSSGNRASRFRRRLGVLKRRRRGDSDVRRIVTCLLRRAVRGRSASPSLRHLLCTVRDAWPEPRSLFDSQSRSPSRRFNVYKRNSALWRDGEIGNSNDIMVSHEMGGAPQPRPDVSPGLLRRRYSVPETIMRKYRVAQQRTDCEESGSSSRGSGGSLPTRTCVAPRLVRDRELMRKSALLRRLWGRTPPCSRCCREESDARHSRSLDGSHSELRRTPTELSPSTYRSHAPADNDAWKSDVRMTSFSGEVTSETEDIIIVSACENPPRSFYGDLFPSSLSADTIENGGTMGCNPVLYQTSENDSGSQLTFAPKTSCEMLEIVMTESSEAHARQVRGSPKRILTSSSVNIDEYVSSVLVESLNSLTDRLELVTSRVPGDGKISVIEKEIKVKLQSTGVNTIVHLSPTSNNQIIFGNEELCDGTEENHVALRETLCIRDEPPAAESDDAAASTQLRSGISDNNDTLDRHEDVNRAVLRQIQKLFREEIRDLDPEVTYGAREVPSISHIEVSNVDFFFDDSTESRIPHIAFEGDHTDLISHSGSDILSGVGTGNYFDIAQISTVVPRFTALPHTASMEVNASSEEIELVGSDCTSLVDSLDDPNSPRNALPRRAFTGRRAELVRSAVDVLELLPETIGDSEPLQVHPKESEYFYIGIEDSECRCKKEIVNVADRMPEKIKQKLYRRHRRRQLRMESARRSRIKENRRDFQKYEKEEAERKRNVERDCAVIIDALINDVISKIAQDEYKCARIKHRSERIAAARLGENPLKKNRKKPLQPIKATATDYTSTRNSFSIDYGPTNNDNEDHNEQRMHQIRGKLSLLTRPVLSTDDERPRRVYQKSEIREGNKCIEILEILEYVNADGSPSNTPGTDEAQGFGAKSNKKSRIPIPVHEKTQRQLRSSVRPIYRNDWISPVTNCNSASQGVRPHRDAEQLVPSPTPCIPLPPAVEPRPRSGSVRFRRIFDVIPEERSSISVESSADDVDQTTCSIAPGTASTSASAPAPTAAAAAAPAMRNVATSPQACAVSDPLRVKLCKDGGRKPRSWPSRREQGTKKKSESVKIKAEQATTLIDPPLRDRNSKRLQTHATVESVEKKSNRAKTDSRVTRPTVSRPLCSFHDVNTENTGRVRGSGNVNMARSRSDEPSETDEEEAYSSSGESVLCPLAPRWLTAPARRRRPRKPAPSPDPGEWSVTVAGSCRAALPADVEMRLRFPRRERHSPRRSSRRNSRFGARCVATGYQECMCSRRPDFACSARTERSASPRLRCAAPPLPTPRRPALTLTVKKEARDSSVLASKSMKKSTDLLPDLETYSSSRSKIKSSLKMRRGCSLQCWPAADDESASFRASEELAVSGCAIIPELKPRVPTMTERDLTRLRRRYCLRS